MVKLLLFALFRLSITFTAMRLIGFVIAIIVLGLSCMPCSDTNAASAKAEVVIQVIDTSSPVSDKTDDCSPFCQCNCCAGFPLQVLSNTVSLPVPEIHITHCGFYNASISHITISIWQPPKINC